ncbi:MAG: ScpA family protein [Rhizonema sp. NSF051]|nr:ScpA family protein [Rhizonema sp. NSF051]
MDASELLETITLLIHQAEQGEIDPWDVKVIEVIDRYIELMAPETITRSYETDLSKSGQAFLSASMLVLFKANTLMELQSAVEEQEAVVETNEDELRHQGSRLPLEKHLRRRPIAMPPPKRRVTLQELIEQLQVMAQQLQLVDKASKTVRSRRQPSLQTMRAALSLAHQENLTEVASELEQVLQQKAIECSQKNWLNLEQLVELWVETKQANQNQSTHQSHNSQLISVFWALLLLSAQSKIEIYQEEFYQDIKIRLLTELASNSNSLEVPLC